MKTHAKQTDAERIAQLEKELLNTATDIVAGRANDAHATRAYRMVTGYSVGRSALWLKERRGEGGVPDDVLKDYNDWKNGTKINYADFWIKPSRDFGIGDNPEPGKHGWVVFKNGCNPMPGAIWAHTIKGTKQLIDVYLAVGGADLPLDDSSKESLNAHAAHAQRFWHLLRAIQAGNAP